MYPISIIRCSGTAVGPASFHVQTLPVCPDSQCQRQYFHSVTDCPWQVTQIFFTVTQILGLLGQVSWIQYPISILSGSGAAVHLDSQRQRKYFHSVTDSQCQIIQTFFTKPLDLLGQVSQILYSISILSGSGVAVGSTSFHTLTLSICPDSHCQCQYFHSCSDSQ